MRNIALATLALTLSACGSSSSSSNAADTSVVLPVTHPILLEGNLFEIDPSSGALSLIAQTTNALSVTLDTDQINAGVDPIDTTTRTPEFYIYLQDSAIWFFDLVYRRSGKLYDLPENTFVCDLKKQKTLDLQLFDASIVSIKDEQAVNLITSASASCDETVSPLIFTKIAIENSFTEVETYETLAETPEIPDEDKCFSEPKTVDFGNDRETSSATIEIECVDESEEEGESENIADTEPETVTERIPALVGKASTLDEALAYTTDPLINLTEGIFGFMGYNQTEQLLKFYLTDEENGEVDRLPYWTQAFDEFTWNNESIRPEFSSQEFRDYASRNRLHFEHGWNIYYFSFDDIFDDDQIFDRIESLDNPLVERPFVNDEANTVYTRGDLPSLFEAGGQVTLLNDNAISLVSPSGGVSDLKSYDEAGTTITSAYGAGGNIVAVKDTAAGTSVITFTKADQIESTLIPVTERLTLTRPDFNSVFYANLSNHTDSTISSSQAFTSALSPYFSAYTTHSLIADMTNQTTRSSSLIIAKGNATTSDETLRDNLLFFVDRNQDEDEAPGEDLDGDTRFGEQRGEGQFFATLTDDIANIVEATIYSANFGLITVNPAPDSDHYRIYYFNPASPYTRVDNPDSPDGFDLEPQALKLVYDSETTTLPTE